ncbi:hypothetical protein VPH35_111215 [Triticum aestivum]
MEGLGDGEGNNGSRGSAVSTSRGEDAFTGAIIATVEDAHHDSVAPVHYIGQQYLDPPNNLVPLTLKQVSMLTPSDRHRVHYRYMECLECLHPFLFCRHDCLVGCGNRTDSTEEINFILGDGTGAIEAKIWTIDGEYMQVLREVRRVPRVFSYSLNGSIRMRDSVMHIQVYSIRFFTRQKQFFFALFLVANYNDITHHFLHCIYLREREMNIRRASRGFLVMFFEFSTVHKYELENGASFSLIPSLVCYRSSRLYGQLFTTIDDDHFKCSFSG